MPRTAYFQQIAHQAPAQSARLRPPSPLLRRWEVLQQEPVSATFGLPQRMPAAPVAALPAPPITSWTAPMPPLDEAAAPMMETAPLTRVSRPMLSSRPPRSLSVPAAQQVTAAHTPLPIPMPSGDVVPAAPAASLRDPVPPPAVQPRRDRSSPTLPPMPAPPERVAALAVTRALESVPERAAVTPSPASRPAPSSSAAAVGRAASPAFPIRSSTPQAQPMLGAPVLVAATAAPPTHRAALDALPGPVMLTPRPVTPPLPRPAAPAQPVVQIGTLDVIVTPPLPLAPPQPVPSRAPAAPAGGGPLARGFSAGFGLRQG